MNFSAYTDKVRVRSCGLLVEDRKLLLVELFSPVTKQWTWLPPGGGVQFGESLKETLIREFREETGIQVSVQKRVQINEVIKPPVHAIEFYFLVKRKSGELTLGSDPELEADEQIIRNIGFFTKEQMQKMETAPAFLNNDFWEIIS